MENYSYNSYPDSRDSSPRSREIDCENASWTTNDDQVLPPSSNYKVKFMCSYGGKIHPRPHDNQLAYVGGDTKILAVDRNIRFSGIISKLSLLCDFDVCFKYQLPGEDLDALISVTNEEDLEHMMIEYDRLLRGSAKPARLRLFLFPLNPSSPASSSADETSKPNQQWFVDALNSVPIGSLDSSSSPPASTNPDFLFGLEKNQTQAQAQAQAQQQQQTQLQSPSKQEILQESSIQEPIPVKFPSGSDSGKDDRYEQGVSPAEIQRQIQELQRLQIANHEQAMFQRKNDEMLARAFPGDYYVQKVQSSATMPTPAPSVHSPVPSPATMSVPTTAYWQDNRHVATGGYPVQVPPPNGSDQPVYYIPAPGPPGPPHPGMYHHHPPQQIHHQQQQQQQGRQMTGQSGQAYYGLQRMVPDHVYRDQPVYGHSMGPPPPQQQQLQQQTKLMGGGGGPGGGGSPGGGYGVPSPASGIPIGESGYAQVAYDSGGRQVYYTSAPGGVVLPSPLLPSTTTYHQATVTTVEGNNKVMKPSQQAPV